MSLSPQDQIPAGQPVTVNFSCIVGPLSTPSSIQAAIYAAFANTSFNCTDVEIGIISTNCDLVGMFDDQDGAGHSGPARNFFESEFESFVKSIVAPVPGLYNFSISSVNMGTGTAPTTWAGVWGSIQNAVNSLPSLGTMGLVLLGVLLLVVMVAVVSWKEAP